jgi:hypothetical protein
LESLLDDERLSIFPDDDRGFRVEGTLLVKLSPKDYGRPRTDSGTPVRFGSGGGIRTPDLRVMSPTSYLAALPRN